MKGSREPTPLLLGAHPANLGGCLSLLSQVGNPTYPYKGFTVAGQRRICTELPLLEELLSYVLTKPHLLQLGNQARRF